MEKVIYSLWAPKTDTIDVFNNRLLEKVVPALLKLGVRGLQLNIRDDAVAACEAMNRGASRPLMDAAIQIWVDSAVNPLRRPVDDILIENTGRMAGYLVCESLPLPNSEFPPVPGQRTKGLSQVVFLKRPPRLTHEAWMDLWHGDQTKLAVELQNNFFYVQNVVMRPLTHCAPHCDAIVEECLYEEAITDPRCRFRGKDFEDREKNAARFMENTLKMVDPDKIDVIQTSQYVFKNPSM